MEIFLIALVIFLSVVGLSELLHRAFIAFLRPKKQTNYLLLMLNSEDAYEQSCAAIAQLKWHGKELAEKIIAVNLNLSEKQCEMCSILQKENENYIFCNKDEVENYL